ncbi:uracil-xanthine permease family protein [Syntrophomonas erecta]
MHFKYDLNQRPPLGENLLYGLQWLAVSIPSIIIIGTVVAGITSTGAIGEVIYLQKLFLATALVLLVQVLWGHRLPLVIGPATVLLIAIIASYGSCADAIYSSIIIGGLLLAVLSVTGLFGSLRRLFTPRVVAVILLLIAFTLAPTIVNLIGSPSPGVSATNNYIFSLLLIVILFIAHRHLKGIWKSTLVLWAMLVGSLVYLFIFPQSSSPAAESLAWFAFYKGPFTTTLTVEPGILLAFLFSFLALSINDLGSLQSIGGLLKAPEMEKRITRGITITGLGNALSGFLGVIGPVNFSLSPGVIASTGCASRYSLVPAALGMGLLSLSPALIRVIGQVPAPIIGTILIYIMCSQISAGMMMAMENRAVSNFDHGLIMGLPLMLGTVVAFLPVEVVSAMPVTLRPLLANGFVVGVLAVLILEHLIYRP